MPITVLEHIKGSDLPSAWQKKLNADPDQTFTVTLEPEDMPLEERISDELVKEVKESEKSYKQGKFTRCKTKKEQDAFFEKAWGTNE
ncbi:MAG: hypothetical protein ABIK98_07480 [Pseudomonadota bacterium]|nr:hypothetical protein [Pseudomonadota bacterium]